MFIVEARKAGDATWWRMGFPKKTSDLAMAELHRLKVAAKGTTWFTWRVRKIND